MTRDNREHRDIAYLSHALECMDQMLAYSSNDNPRVILLNFAIIGEVFYNYRDMKGKLSSDLKNLLNSKLISNLSKLRDMIVHPARSLKLIEEGILTNFQSDRDNLQEVSNYTKSHL